MTEPIAPLQRPDLVIFDCDGVLVDSERLSIAVEVELLAELGWPLTEADIVERFLGRSDKDMLAQIEAQIGPQPHFLDQYRDRFYEAVEQRLEAVPGIGSALDAIEAAGVQTCVASSGTHDRMGRTLGRTGLHDRFEGRIHSSTQVEHGKPAPDLFLFAAASMGVDPSRCVVIEDSLAGIAGATAAGMRSVAYSSGLVSADALGAAATVVIDDMADLPGVLDI